MDRKTLWFSCLFFVFLSTWVAQAQEQPARALVYSTYFGGSGDDEGGGIALDAQGNIYVAGTTSSTNFPTTPNAHQRVLRGGHDAFVTRFDANGSLVYSTYLGDECDDYGTALAVDAEGNAYVTGRANFLCSPLVPRRPGTFVAKLDPTGALRYFFIFGGRFADISTGQAIAVDAEGNVHVAGWTNVSDFPTTPGAFQRTYGGGLRDGFVAKVNAAGDGLVYSTYLGGSGSESVNGIAVDEDGHAYVTGSTDSRDFPVRNAFQPNPRGGPTTKTGFVTKLSPDGSALVYSTYLGGRFTDVAAGIAVDEDGNAYVTGETESDDFPTTPGVLQPDPGWRICTWYLCTDAFVTKLNAAGDALVYSTYLYGENSDGGAAIAVDADGNAYVVGKTASIYFPIVSAFQPNSGLNTDAFVAKLNPTASELVYSSYLGGRRSGPSSLDGEDLGLGIAVHEGGNAFVTGVTRSSNFPTTPDAWQPRLGGGICDVFQTPCSDAFVTKIATEGPGVVPDVSLSTSPTNVPVGGTLTATWAGIPRPSPRDRLGLAKLGGRSTDVIVVWPTTGEADGSIELTLPMTLPPGTYELRLLTDVDFLQTTLARSSPFRVERVYRKAFWQLDGA